ncbi:MAG: enoyl-CoA hydratase-related protein [Oceanococcus sp.]
MSQDVLIERRGQVQWITINREARRNAMNAAVIQEISQGIADAIEQEARAIVLTGVGEKAFCAGADLTKGVKGFAFDVDFSRPRHYIVQLFKQLQDCPLPVIARVNGHAMAGGFGLMCACDMAIAADDIRFGTSESKIGLTPMMILPYMIRMVPPRQLQEMCITGEQFTAAQGLDWGLFNYVVPREQLDEKIDWLLERITPRSPTAIRLGKQAFSATRDMDLRSALEYAQAMVPIMSSTEDAAEGLSAFQEKRAPEWTGN